MNRQTYRDKVEEERSMAGKYPSTDSAQGANFGQEADKAREVKDAAFDATRSAGRKIDEARPAVAERLETAASTIEERAEKIPGGQRVKEFTQAAADRLSTTADYVRSNDARRMVSDLEEVVKKNPWPAVLVGAFLGFILGRAAVRN